MVSKRKLDEIHRWDEEISGKGPSPWVKTMEEYAPEILEAYFDFRKAAMQEKANGLPRWVKELIVVAVNVALRSPWGGAGHVRNAMRLGANVTQVHEAVQIAMMVSATTAYVASGQVVVEKAEEELKEIKGLSRKK